MNCLRALIILSLLFIYAAVTAQVPSDLSNVKASQISDAQLRSYVKQAQASGLSNEQLGNELLRRGLPPTELSELQIRIQRLSTAEPQSDTESTITETSDLRRTSPKNTPNNYESFEAIKKRSKIFGSELFSNNNLSFEPNLRMATPKNYIIGPDDELNLNIYGLNISQQKLKVSPEGNINIKYAGIVNVSGMSIEAANAVIKSRLIKYYPALQSGGTHLELSLGNIRSIRVILIGAVNRPGTYSLPSLSSLFNALYVSGGPAENGSFRNIELIRNNKVIQTADLYDFLSKGDLSGNVHLEDNDVIRIPFAKLLITLNGEVNRPGIFEVHTDESLNDVLQFAGGFKSKAFRNRITGNRYTDYDRRVIDIAGDSLQFFKPRNGDEYLIDSVINRYQNRVIIHGAVFKPGAYALESGMTLRQLINKAQGLKEDAYSGRALVVRTRSDLSKEYMSVELGQIISGSADGIVLQREDSVQVASIFDLRDTASVTINGAVRQPGTYRYEKKLSLKSLLLKAQGFADNATGTNIEISRRKHNVDINKPGSDIVEIIRLNDNMELSNSNADIELMPFDIITVKEDPFYKKQISVKISGEVMLPAVYTLQSREERLSSIINRSGGLLYTANIRGAKLVRKKKEATDTTEIRRLFQTVKRDTSLTNLPTLSKTTTDVAIDLDYILKHPGSADDITLEEGDELIVPRINNTVSVNGEVFRPVDIMYERGKSMPDYLSDAGGITQAGKSRRTFVIYPSGKSAKIKRILGLFPSYPKIEPGSQIFVPQKPKREGFDLAKAGILVSALTALVTAISIIKR